MELNLFAHLSLSPSLSLSFLTHSLTPTTPLFSIFSIKFHHRSFSPLLLLITGGSWCAAVAAVEGKFNLLNAFFFSLASRVQKSGGVREREREQGVNNIICHLALKPRFILRDAMHTHTHTHSKEFIQVKSDGRTFQRTIKMVKVKIFHKLTGAETFATSHRFSVCE